MTALEELGIFVASCSTRPRLGEILTLHLVDTVAPG